ncbi:GAP family protein [Actinomyces capricornis]|uniref:Sap-like sulfolipid-1-addressing protein n=1 Tax=Actinomyces capricornis TaxID=2755559 RepID=A0ABM7U9L8_9ACTO|nr:GAP family protein [Actinomyces capricornis]BDA64095.1 hypothetical protein MANAM107_09290 [Actinomyces capricornis]
MHFSDLGALALLALIDSTSTGTLIIPVAMLLQPRVRYSRILGYLLTICLFYWALGMALALAGTGIAVLPGLRGALESTAVYVVQLVIGIGLFAGSYLVDGKAQARRRARRGSRPSLVARMMGTALGPQARWDAVITLALAAGLIEAASMLPYLGAIGLLIRAELPTTAVAAVLVAYAALMAAPALALTAGRAAVGNRAEGALERTHAFIARHSADSLAWVMGILGFLLAADAASALWR